MISNPEHRQIFQQQPIVQQQPEVIQQQSMILQKSNPVQDNNTSFVSYQDLHSRQYLDSPAETPEEWLQIVNKVPKKIDCTSWKILKSSKRPSQPLELPESNPIPMDPQSIQPSYDNFTPGSQKPKRYNKYGDEIFED